MPTNSPLVIGFDADDTLWHNETRYRQAARRLHALLKDYGDAEAVDGALADTEIRNVPLYGYGIKSFTLSMVEAAVKISAGTVPADIIGSILEIGRDVLNAEIELFEGVREVVEQLAEQFTLMLITKGDLLEQQSKVRRSGLRRFFAHVEIVHEKSAETYRHLLERHSIPPAQFVMVGNSMKSDILPALEIGAQAVYVPYELTWSHEHADGSGQDYREIRSLEELPDILTALETPTHGT